MENSPTETPKDNRGGKRPGAGRPFGATAQTKLTFKAMWDEAITTSDKQAVFRKLADLAKSGDMVAIKLFMEYEAGKPIERKEIVGDSDQPLSIKVVWEDILAGEEDNGG